MRLRPAQLSRAPVWVLQVFRATPVQPSCAAEPHEPPVVRAFVQEKGLAGRDAVNVDLMRFQVVRERLLDVEDHPVDAGVLAQAGPEIALT